MKVTHNPEFLPTTNSPLVEVKTNVILDNSNPAVNSEGVVQRIGNPQYKAEAKSGSPLALEEAIKIVESCSGKINVDTEKIPLNIEVNILDKSTEGFKGLSFRVPVPLQEDKTRPEKIDWFFEIPKDMNDQEFLEFVKKEVKLYQICIYDVIDGALSIFGVTKFAKGYFNKSFLEKDKECWVREKEYLLKKIAEIDLIKKIRELFKQFANYILEENVKEAAKTMNQLSPKLYKLAYGGKGKEDYGRPRDANYKGMEKSVREAIFESDAPPAMIYLTDGGYSRLLVSFDREKRKVYIGLSFKSLDEMKEAFSKISGGEEELIFNKESAASAISAEKEHSTSPLSKSIDEVIEMIEETVEKLKFLASKCTFEIFFRIGEIANMTGEKIKKEQDLLHWVEDNIGEDFFKELKTNLLWFKLSDPSPYTVTKKTPRKEIREKLIKAAKVVYDTELNKAITELAGNLWFFVQKCEFIIYKSGGIFTTTMSTKEENLVREHIAKHVDKFRTLENAKNWLNLKKEKVVIAKGSSMRKIWGELRKAVIYFPSVSSVTSKHSKEESSSAITDIGGIAFNDGINVNAAEGSSPVTLAMFKDLEFLLKNSDGIDFEIKRMGFITLDKLDVVATAGPQRR